MADPGWLSMLVPFVKDAKGWEILKEHVALLTAQRDDAMRELDKSDAALADAKEQITGLQRQIDDLKKEVARLSPATDLSKETIDVLLLFFEEGTPLSPDYIADARSMKIGVANYHCDILLKKEFVWLAQAGWAGQPFPYSITSEGRAFIVSRGLA